MTIIRSIRYTSLTNLDIPTHIDAHLFIMVIDYVASAETQYSFGCILGSVRTFVQYIIGLACQYCIGGLYSEIGLAGDVSLLSSLLKFYRHYLAIFISLLHNPIPYLVIALMAVALTFCAGVSCIYCISRLSF